MDKRGVTVQSMLIGIIIAIIGAVIILFFLKALPWQSTVDKEACHNSVVLRNNAILKGETIIPVNIPLNCKTQEVKISSSNEEFIKREIANAMYDCWWMLGEGKMQFWSESGWKEFGLAGVKSSCVICSTIRFDETIKEKNLQLDMASYMERTRVPNKNITYLEYFTEEAGTKLPTDIEAPKITTDKDYVVLFMGIEGDELWEPIVRDLGFVAGSLVGSGFLIGPKATGSILKWGGGIMSKSIQLGGTPLTDGAGKVIGKLGGASIKAGYIALIAAAVFMATQTAVTARNQHIVATHCNGERKGCMQVMLLPMDAANIAGVCNNIESIP